MSYNTTPSVGVLVVTFNRIEYLKNLIKSLSKIDYPICELLIFDNNSDYPIEHLNFIKKISFNGNPIVSIKRSKINLGGSGGFHYGIKELYKKFDFVWTMDDDVSFNPSALSELIEISKNNVVSVPVKINKNDKIIDVTATNLNLERSFFLQHKYGFVKDIKTESNKILVETFSFEGVLFPSLILKKIGLPVNNYFIAHDDLEYSCRLKKK
jgi:GT2 family glycosyltransferase